MYWIYLCVCILWDTYSMNIFSMYFLFYADIKYVFFIFYVFFFSMRKYTVVILTLISSKINTNRCILWAKLISFWRLLKQSSSLSSRLTATDSINTFSMWTLIWGKNELSIRCRIAKCLHEACSNLTRTASSSFSLLKFICVPSSLEISSINWVRAMLMSSSLYLEIVYNCLIEFEVDSMDLMWLEDLNSLLLMLVVVREVAM